VAVAVLSAGRGHVYDHVYVYDRRFSGRCA